MIKSTIIDTRGFTLIEVMLVIAIIGVLASIAIPNMAVYSERARAVSCLANRRNIENDEVARFAENQSSSLNPNNAYQCPSSGIYVWLVTDPEDPDYPKVACSVHYAGSSGDSQQPTEPDKDTKVLTAEAFEELFDMVYALGLPKKVEKELIKKLKRADKQYNKDKIEKSDKAIDSFKNKIKKNSEDIDDEDVAVLLSKADELQELLKQLP
jgi:prepilin-type N-terminal cleavage/methylation domain-containing protein